MISRWLAAFACGLILAFSGPALAQKALVREDLRNAAIRLETDLRQEAPNASSRPAAAWRADAAAALRANNAQAASRAAAAAIVAEPRDPANWLAYANTALAIAAATQDWSTRYTNRERASTAAYAAYERFRARPRRRRRSPCSAAPSRCARCGGRRSTPIGSASPPTRTRS